MAHVDGELLFATSSLLASQWEAYEKMTQGLRMWLVIKNDQQPITAREVIFHWCSCNPLPDLVLSDFKCFGGLRTILSISKMFKVEHGFSFTEAKTSVLCKNKIPQAWIEVYSLKFPLHLNGTQDFVFKLKTEHRRLFQKRHFHWSKVVNIFEFPTSMYGSRIPPFKFYKVH